MRCVARHTDESRQWGGGGATEQTSILGGRRSENREARSEIGPYFSLRDTAQGCLALQQRPDVVAVLYERAKQTAFCTVARIARHLSGHGVKARGCAAVRAPRRAGMIGCRCVRRVERRRDRERHCVSAGRTAWWSVTPIWSLDRSFFFFLPAVLIPPVPVTASVCCDCF